MDKKNNRLQELKEASLRLDQMTPILEDAKRELRRKTIDLNILEKVLKKEQKDVNQLERISIKKLIVSFKGDVSERLEKEVGEYETAKKAYDMMKQEHQALEKLVNQLQADYDIVAKNASEFQDALLQKRLVLERKIPGFAEQLQDIESKIKDIKLAIIEDSSKMKQESNAMRGTSAFQSVSMSSGVFGARNMGMTGTTGSKYSNKTLGPIGSSRERSTPMEASVLMDQKIELQDERHKDHNKKNAYLTKRHDQTDDLYREIEHLNQSLYQLIIDTSVPQN